MFCCDAPALIGGGRPGGEGGGGVGGGAALASIRIQTAIFDIDWDIQPAVPNVHGPYRTNPHGEFRILGASFPLNFQLNAPNGRQPTMTLEIFDRNNDLVYDDFVGYQLGNGIVMLDDVRDSYPFDQSGMPAAPPLTIRLSVNTGVVTPVAQRVVGVQGNVTGFSVEPVPNIVTPDRKVNVELFWSNTFHVADDNPKEVVNIANVHDVTDPENQFGGDVGLDPDFIGFTTFNADSSFGLRKFEGYQVKPRFVVVDQLSTTAAFATWVIVNDSAHAHAAPPNKPFAYEVFARGNVPIE